MCNQIMIRLIALSIIALVSSCSSYQNHVNPMQRQASASNLIEGQAATEQRQSEMIAAGIGALGNSLVVDYQDRLESALRHKIQGSGIEIQREGNIVRVLLPPGATFAPMHAELSPQCYPALDALAEILEHYRQTMIEVVGYADLGAPSSQRLPAQRAAEISAYLVARQLRHERFEMVGLTHPRRVAGHDRAHPAAPAQAEIRLLPLQRSVSMQPRERELKLVNTGLFVAL